MTYIQEVVCSTKADDFVKPFEWTEAKISCFGVYTVFCKSMGWCDCIECFKRRYNEAEEKIVSDNFKDSSSLNSAIINLMKY